VNPTHINTWSQYEKLVLRELKRLSDLIEKQSEMFDNFKTTCVTSRLKCAEDISRLKTQSSIWGALGGLIAAVTILVFEFVR